MCIWNSSFWMWFCLLVCVNTGESCKLPSSLFAKCLLYFLSSVPYYGKSLDDENWACANQTSVGVIHRSLCAATAAHPEQTQNSTVIPGSPEAHTRLLSSSSDGERSLGVFPASFWARHSAVSDFVCWKTLCPRSSQESPYSRMQDCGWH